MTLRKWLASKIDPEMARDARAHWYLRMKMDEAATWLGYDFPMIDAAIFWAKVSTVNHFRLSEAEYVHAVPEKPWIHQISDFREHLRKTYLPAPPADQAPPKGDTP